MRNLKFSLALIVAVAAVSIAMISKANVLSGKARILGCFVTVELADISGGNTISPIVDATSCDAVRSHVATNSAFYLKNISSASAVETTPCTQDVEFCCVQLEPTSDNPSVPTFDLGDGTPQKYQILGKLPSNVLCRP